MKTIKATHKAVYEPIGDLVTYRVMPLRSLTMNQLDPFIFLNHHGWQQYLPMNGGLPFGPHPHRGFETVTFIIEGDLVHKDTTGVVSEIKAGGIQWMTAGSGIIHAEISSDSFKKTGGPLEVLQLWVNLPAKYKMTPPKYTGLQKDEIPSIEWDGGKVICHPVSGMWENTEGPVHPFSDINLAWFTFTEGGKHTFAVHADKHILCYVVKGGIKINGEEIHQHYLVEFNTDGANIEMKATTDAVLLFGFATPFGEPIVAYGPFVMNTKEEIQQAYVDLKAGKLGDAKSL